jgi:HAD superfamily hydrolase (TIGR01549 family)
MDAVVFDLGGTLVEYSWATPRWEQHYGDALRAMAGVLGVSPHPGQLGRASAVLRSHNPRLHPREHEVPFTRMLEELLPCFGVTGNVDTDACTVAFFDVYREPLQCCEDTVPAIEGLRSRKKRLGVFGDAAYGMPTRLLREDVRAAGLLEEFDVFLTSVDTGFRKPSGEALRRVAEALGCAPSGMMYVGDEEKDVATAKAAGCRAVIIDRRNQRPNWGQDRLIGNLQELWVEHGWF